MVADAMLGRLATWLRILGFDTAFGHDMTEAVFLSLVREGRTGLTRRRRFEGRAGIVFIESDHWEEQLVQAVKGLEITKDDIELYSRCSRCNLELTAAGRDEAQGQVPEYVWRTQELFVHCKGCNRYYWRGTHPKRMEAVLDRVFAAEES